MKPNNTRFNSRKACLDAYSIGLNVPSRCMVYRLIGVCLGITLMCSIYSLSLSEKLLTFIAILIVFGACVARQTIGGSIQNSGDVNTVFDAVLVFTTSCFLTFLGLRYIKPPPQVFIVTIGSFSTVVILAAIVFESGRRCRDNSPVEKESHVESGIHNNGIHHTRIETTTGPLKNRRTEVPMQTPYHTDGLVVRRIPPRPIRHTVHTPHPRTQPGVHTAVTAPSATSAPSTPPTRTSPHQWENQWENQYQGNPGVSEYDTERKTFPPCTTGTQENGTV